MPCDFKHGPVHRPLTVPVRSRCRGESNSPNPAACCPRSCDLHDDVLHTETTVRSQKRTPTSSEGKRRQQRIDSSPGRTHGAMRPHAATLQRCNAAKRHHKKGGEVELHETHCYACMDNVAPPPLPSTPPHYTATQYATAHHSATTDGTPQRNTTQRKSKANNNATTQRRDDATTQQRANERYHSRQRSRRQRSASSFVVRRSLFIDTTTQSFTPRPSHAH